MPVTSVEIHIRDPKRPTSIRVLSIETAMDRRQLLSVLTMVSDLIKCYQPPIIKVPASTPADRPPTGVVSLPPGNSKRTTSHE
jgi:hypothetical protein